MNCAIIGTGKIGIDIYLKCKKNNLFDKSYTYWEDRDITLDELDIINFLDKKKR